MITHTLTFLAGLVLGAIVVIKIKGVLEKIINYLYKIKNKIPTFIVGDKFIQEDDHVGIRPPKPPKD